MSRRNLQHVLGVVLSLTLAAGAAFSKNDAPKWLRITSSHFTVLTDAGEKKGREALLRLEQMRSLFGQLLMRNKVNLAEPIDIIVLGDEQKYLATAPLKNGRPIDANGFFLRGEDRIYAVLNGAYSDSWMDVSHDFALFLMDFNYPPAQPWFDEGLAGYFSSFRVNDKQTLIGGDPGARSQSAPGTSRPEIKPYVEVLKTQPWLPITQLFGAKRQKEPSAVFNAESWIVMHYLLGADKLSEAGTYLGLVQLQHASIEEAVQKAFGVSAQQLEQTVKGHFQTVTQQLQTQNAPGGPVQSVSVPGALDVGANTQEIREPEAQALLAEMAVRMPDHRKAAVQQLTALMDVPKGENAIEHRALAWVAIEEKRYQAAREELGDALELDNKDPWTHHYQALGRYKETRAGGKTALGLANTFQDLRFVIDWYPSFADAYNMLAMARIDGGGTNSAKEAMKTAIQLSPRNEEYLYNMARIEMAGKEWDAAAKRLEGLTHSANPLLVKAAQKDLADLPTLKKYGIPPERHESPSEAQPASAKPPQSGEDTETEGSDEEGTKQTQTKADTRPVKFAKGKLLSVDCANTPAAVLTVLLGARRMELRTPDFKALTLVGVDAFSCDWRNRIVAVNYKAVGQTNGDLVSLEVQ